MQGGYEGDFKGEACRRTSTLFFIFLDDVVDVGYPRISCRETISAP